MDTISEDMRRKSIVNDDPNHTYMNWMQRGFSKLLTRGSSSTNSSGNILAKFKHIRGECTEKMRCDLYKVRKNDPHLTELTYCGEKLGDEGAKELAEVLKTNTTVRKLEIICHVSERWNSRKVGDEGAKALVRMMRSNTTLRSFNITGNKFGAEGGKALAEMLKKNTTLLDLHISNNYISNDSSLSIAALVAGNRTLSNQHEEIGRRSDDTISYYIKGYGSVYMMQSDDSNTTHWMWTEKAWEAVNSADGRVTQLLLNCLKTAKMKENKESLKHLAENDEKNGNLLLHIAACKTHSAILGLLKFFIDDVEVDIECAEKSGRTIRDVAMNSVNEEIGSWARAYGSFLGRYRIDGGNGLRSDPVHESETCAVYFATDIEKAANDHDRLVAIKLMFKSENFERELQARLVVDINSIERSKEISIEQNKYDRKHVVPLYRYHDDAKDKKGNACWCLVLEKGAKSIHQIIDSEQIAGIDTERLISCGRDVARAIKHMHEGNMVHADIKPRNAIRTFDGDIKLIDLDASVEDGDILTDKKMSTAYIPPEVATVKFRPIETEEELNKGVLELREKRKELDNDENGDEAIDEEHEKISREIIRLNNKIKIKKNNASPVIKANKSMDIWGFGVTMYYFFTKKKNLFRCSQADDTLDREDEQMRLANWNGISDEELNEILPECEYTILREKAQNFFKKCLHGDINQRHKNMDEILDDPLFSGASKGVKNLQEDKKELEHCDLMIEQHKEVPTSTGEDRRQESLLSSSVENKDRQHPHENSEAESLEQDSIVVEISPLTIIDGIPNSNAKSVIPSTPVQQKTKEAEDTDIRENETKEEMLKIDPATSGEKWSEETSIILPASAVISTPNPLNDPEALHFSVVISNGGCIEFENIIQKEIRKDQLRHITIQNAQERILLLRHVAKCTVQGNDCPTVGCARMKELWKHILQCANKSCQVSQCISSRYILSHYNTCNSPKCDICPPVRSSSIDQDIIDNGKKKLLQRGSGITFGCEHGAISALSFGTASSFETSIRTISAGSIETCEVSANASMEKIEEHR